jgi:hypothetical protein
VRGITGRHLLVEETEVVVTMDGLRGAARIDHVDLGGHLVGRPEPGLARKRQHLVAVVVDEGLRVLHRKLLQCVPDPVVRPRRGEVVAGRAACATLPIHERGESCGSPVHHVGVERTGDDEDPGTVAEDRPPLGEKLFPGSHDSSSRAWRPTTRLPRRWPAPRAPRY